MSDPPPCIISMFCRWYTWVLSIFFLVSQRQLSWYEGLLIKSLARSGRKQATLTKLGIYSTHSPQSSIHFLARCSNFCKTLKKIRILSAQPGLQGSNDLRVGRKMANFQLFFSVQRTGGSPMGPDPENRVGDQDTGSPGRPVSSVLQVSGEPGHSRARTGHSWWTSRGVFPSKSPSVAPTQTINNPRWYFGPLEDNQWGGCCLDPKILRRELFQRIFSLGIFWSGVGHYTATPLIVASTPGHSNITRFLPWSPIAPDRKSFGSRRKISKNCSEDWYRWLFDPRSGISGPTSRRASACPNLHEWWAQPAHVRCTVAQLLI